ncbi:MAG: guanylate kinase [Candidatus Cloacimonetes bacterium]|nr:guanylate kinase [Candidatus Cloacimonadota bacterium]
MLTKNSSDNHSLSGFGKRSFLIILIAPSGGGKSTIAGRILQDAENIDYSISYTTRSPRGLEENGKQYFFVKDEDFERLIAEDDLLEHATVHGYQYGTSRSFIQSRLAMKHHVIMDIDVQGAIQIMKSEIDTVTVFVLPPNETILRNRLTARGTDSPEVIARRLINARGEIAQMQLFDYLVINDDLDEAVEQVNAIICAEELKTARYTDVERIFYGSE